MQASTSELRVVDQPHRHNGHRHIDGAHGDRRVERPQSSQSGVLEDLGRVEHRNVDAGELLGEHHHDGDDHWPAERGPEHVNQAGLGLVLGSRSFLFDDVEFGADLKSFHSDCKHENYVIFSSQLLEVFFRLVHFALNDQVVLW